MKGFVTTGVGNIPIVASRLAGADRRGTVKARLGIGRMRYTVQPGLYAVGSPTPESPVFASANYKGNFI